MMKSKKTSCVNDCGGNTIPITPWRFFSCSCCSCRMSGQFGIAFIPTNEEEMIFLIVYYHFLSAYSFYDIRRVSHPNAVQGCRVGRFEVCWLRMVVIALFTAKHSYDCYSLFQLSFQKQSQSAHYYSNCMLMSFHTATYCSYAPT